MIGRYFVYSGWRKRSHTSNRPWKGLWTSLVSERQDVAKLQPLVQKKQTKRNPRFILDPNMSGYQRLPTFVRTTNSQQTPWIRNGLNDPDFEFRQEPETYLFSTTSKPAPGPNQPPTQRVLGLFTREKRPRHEVNHSPASGAEFKNGGLVPLRLLYTSMVRRNTFYLLPYKGYINATGTVEISKLKASKLGKFSVIDPRSLFTNFISFLMLSTVQWNFDGF